MKPVQLEKNEDMHCPTGLMVNLMSEPMGVDCRNLRFSWIMNSSQNDTIQVGYQILVASSRENIERDIGDVWDSKKVNSDESINVRYQGDELEENTLYYWKVKTWSNHGTESPFSAPAVLTTQKNHWEADAIWAHAETQDNESNIIFARRSFVLDGEIESAILTITAARDGGTKQYTYKAYLNGHLVGMGPQFAVYDGLWLYNTYNVTSLLHAGENVIGAICYSLSERKLMAELKITYTDGGTEIIKADNSWHVLDGTSIYGDNGTSIGTGYYTAMAENINMQLFPTGWSKHGYRAEHWSPAAVKPQIGCLQASITDPVKQFEITPQNIVKMSEGEYFIDFGKEIVGGIQLCLQDVTNPTTLEIRYGEELEDGRVKYMMRTGNTYQEFFTLRPGNQTIENFGLKCFRYAEILHSPTDLQEAHIKALAIHLPISEEESAFHSDSETLNEVYELCKYSIIATSQDVLVDSQSRERGPYEGDLYVNQLGLYSLARQYNLARYTNIYLTYEPTWCQEYHQLSILSAWEDYWYTGDKTALEQLYPLLKGKLLDYQTAYNKEYHLYFHNIFGHGWDAALIDWPNSQRDGYVGSDYITVVNVFHYAGALLLSKIADILGHPDDKLFYEELAEELRKGILTLYDCSKYRFSDGKDSEGNLIDHWAQHASFFPMAFGILENHKELEQKTANLLQQDGVRCSIYGIQYLLTAMYQAGEDDYALRILTSREEKNSWHHVIHRLNATITPESWDPSHKGNMTFSHAWGTAPANIIVRNLCGIVPLEAGCRKLMIKPQAGALTKIQMKAPVIRGTVAMDLDLTAQKMTVTLPANTVADIYVPYHNQNAHGITMDGNEIEAEKTECYFVIRNVGSGTHTFAVS